jgi:hypothetical protein
VNIEKSKTNGNDVEDGRKSRRERRKEISE